MRLWGLLGNNWGKREAVCCPRPVSHLVCQVEGKERYKATPESTGHEGGWEWGVPQVQDLLQHISLLSGFTHSLRL